MIILVLSISTCISLLREKLKAVELMRCLISSTQGFSTGWLVFCDVPSRRVQRHLFLPPNDNYQPVNNGSEKRIMPLTRIKVASSLDAASLA